MRDARALDFGKRLAQTAVKFTNAEEYHEARDEYGGIDAPEFSDGRVERVWDPRERCQAPEAAHLPAEVSDWDDAKKALDWSTTIILGGGESALDHNWTWAADLPIYGINWALRWFEPTVLHAHDNQVIHTEVTEGKPFRNRKRPVQIVTQFGNMPEVERAGGKALTYKTGNIHEPDPTRLFRFARYPGEELEYAPNSLMWALNCVYWLGAKRILLVGFDWGGYHFIGDGRMIGAKCAYGADGAGAKKHLPAYLSAMGYHLLQRGVSVTLVGRTKLRGVFPHASTLEAALNG